MRWADLIRRASRGLRSAKVRTLLTSLAIGVGGFALAMTLAASNGITNYANNLIDSNFDPSVLIVAKDFQLFGRDTTTGPREYDESVIQQGEFNVKTLTVEDLSAIREVDGIESVKELYQVTPQYVTRDASSKKYSATIESYSSGQKPVVAYGSLPEQDLAKGEVIIPDDFLTAFNFTSPEDAVGKTIIVTVRKVSSTPPSAEQFQQAVAAAGGDVALASQTIAQQAFETKEFKLSVVAVTKKAATELSFTTKPLLVGFEQAKEITEFTTIDTPNFQKYIVAYADVVNGDQKDKRDAVQKQLVDMGYNVQSVEDTQKFLLDIVSFLTIGVGLFSVISLIASVFGIVNTQYISVLERTREIGLMKALGMRGKDILRLFSIEATWIGFLGGLMGIVLAVITTLIANPIINNALSLEPGNEILVNQPLQLLGLIVMLMVIATVAGLLPAIKAAKLDPIEALRTE